MLALAHHIDAKIEAGEVGSYAAVASALGLTRARLTQVMDLLLLAPSIQERIALGTLEWSERGLRRVIRKPCWAQQRSALDDVEQSGSKPTART